MRQGDLAAAREFFQLSLGVGQRLTKADSKNADARNLVSIAYERLGDVALAAGDWGAAGRYYDAKSAIDEELAALDPTNVKFQRDLAISQGKLGDHAYQAEGSDRRQKVLSAAAGNRPTTGPGRSAKRASPERPFPRVCKPGRRGLVARRGTPRPERTTNRNSPSMSDWPAWTSRTSSSNATWRLTYDRLGTVSMQRRRRTHRPEFL